MKWTSADKVGGGCMNVGWSMRVRRGRSESSRWTPHLVAGKVQAKCRRSRASQSLNQVQASSSQVKGS